MTWQIKAGIYLALAAAIFLAGVYVTRDHYLAKMNAREAEWSKATAVATQLQLDQVQANDQLKLDAEIQHGKDQLVVNNLRGQLADGVHVHIPAGGCTAGQTAAAGADPDGTAGVLPNRVDAAFARLQNGIDRLAARCDQLNIDARAMNVSVGK